MSKYETHEGLTKEEHNTQIKGGTEFPLSFRGSPPILYSLGDAIQILSRLEKRKGVSYT